MNKKQTLGNNKANGMIVNYLCSFLGVGMVSEMYFDIFFFFSHFRQCDYLLVFGTSVANFDELIAKPAIKYVCLLTA